MGAVRKTYIVYNPRWLRLAGDSCIFGVGHAYYPIGGVNVSTVDCGDLVGRRFGHLEVLALARVGPRGGKTWTCRCDCGALTDRDTAHLIRGHVKSCGCTAAGKSLGVSRDLAGRRFGRLVALSQTGARTWGYTVLAVPVRLRRKNRRAIDVPSARKQKIVRMFMG